MIHAFAIDPDIAAGWAKNGQLGWMRDTVGLGQPRALMALPSHRRWMKGVLERAKALGTPDHALKRLSAFLQRLIENSAWRDQLSPDLDDWLETAVSQFDMFPFAGVITAAPTDHPAILAAPYFHEDSRWDCPSGLVVSREPAAFAAALTPMFVGVRRIKLVDPHFKFGVGRRSGRYVDTLVELAWAANAVSGNGFRIEVYCNTHVGSSDYVHDQLERIAERLPTPIPCRVFRLTEVPGGPELHNRCVMTGIGGVTVGHGLDPSEARNASTDDLNIMGADQWQQRMRDYDPRTTPFRVEGEPVTVVGRAKRRRT